MQNPTFFSGNKAAGGAVEQFYAVMLFQLADVLADGTGADAQRLRGGVHAAVLQNGVKNQDLFEMFHGLIVKYFFKV